MSNFDMTRANKYQEIACVKYKLKLKSPSLIVPFTLSNPNGFPPRQTVKKKLPKIRDENNVYFASMKSIELIKNVRKPAAFKNDLFIFVFILFFYLE